MQATTDRVTCVPDPHQHQPPPPETSHSQQGAAPRHGEGGQRRLRTVSPRHTACCGPRPGPAPPTTDPQQQPHTTCPLPTTTGLRKGGYPVVSNWPLHCGMQQRCHHASALFIGPEPVLADHAPSPPASGSHCPARAGSALHFGTEFFNTSNRPAAADDEPHAHASVNQGVAISTDGLCHLFGDHNPSSYLNVV